MLHNSVKIIPISKSSSRTPTFYDAKRHKMYENMTTKEKMLKNYVYVIFCLSILIVNIVQKYL